MLYFQTAGSKKCSCLRTAPFASRFRRYRLAMKCYTGYGRKCEAVAARSAGCHARRQLVVRGANAQNEVSRYAQRSPATSMTCVSSCLLATLASPTWYWRSTRVCGSEIRSAATQQDTSCPQLNDLQQPNVIVCNVCAILSRFRSRGLPDRQASPVHGCEHRCSL